MCFFRRNVCIIRPQVEYVKALKGFLIHNYYLDDGVTSIYIYKQCYIRSVSANTDLINQTGYQHYIHFIFPL